MILQNVRNISPNDTVLPLRRFKSLQKNFKASTKRVFNDPGTSVMCHFVVTPSQTVKLEVKYFTRPQSLGTEVHGTMIELPLKLPEGWSDGQTCTAGFTYTSG
jgi:hypothetical protein